MNKILLFYFLSINLFANFFAGNIVWACSEMWDYSSGTLVRTCDIICPSGQTKYYVPTGEDVYGGGICTKNQPYHKTFVDLTTESGDIYCCKDSPPPPTTPPSTYTPPPYYPCDPPFYLDFNSPVPGSCSIDGCSYYCRLSCPSPSYVKPVIYTPVAPETCGPPQSSGASYSVKGKCCTNNSSPTPPPTTTPSTPTPTVSPPSSVVPPGSPSVPTTPATTITPTPTVAVTPTTSPPTSVPTWDPDYHRCGKGNNGTIPASPVSSRIGGDRSNGQQFINAVNPRLACCLNSSNGRVPSYLASNPLPPPLIGGAPPVGDDLFGSGKKFEKYDCVENESGASFDSLWNTPVDGLSNSVSLKNAKGEKITGFYSLDGQPCKNFGEMGEIIPATVNPTITKNVQLNSTSSVSAYCESNSAGTLPAAAGRTPLDSDRPAPQCINHRGKDLLACPIVVRAAFVAVCPQNRISGSNTIVRTYADDAGVKHCGMASAVKIHLQIKQVFTIAGKPPIKTIDTVIDSAKAATIDVRQLLTSGR